MLLSLPGHIDIGRCAISSGVPAVFCLVEGLTGVVVEELLNRAREELRRDARVDPTESLGEVALNADLVAELREDRLDVAAGDLPVGGPLGVVGGVRLRDRPEVHGEGLGEGELHGFGRVAFVPEEETFREAGREGLPEVVLGGQVGEFA